MTAGCLILEEYSPFPGDGSAAEWVPEWGEGLVLRRGESDFDTRMLFRWENHGRGFGYYTNYIVGACRVPDPSGGEYPVVVLPKIRNLDFFSIVSACAFGHSADSLDGILEIDFDAEPIEAPQARSLLTTVIAALYFTLMERLLAVGLKKDYIDIEENRRSVKGRVRWFRNLTVNTLRGHDERVVCRYGEYTVDTPWNRILKKALAACGDILHACPSGCRSRLQARVAGAISRMEGVDETRADLRSVRTVSRTGTVFRRYAAALKTARCILRFRDFALASDNASVSAVPPFWIDMPLLFERYARGLLEHSFPGQIIYQFRGLTGYPDFLSMKETLILDTKYIPALEGENIDAGIVRQLAGYSRDNRIRRVLGVNDPDATIACVLIYPEPVSAAVFNSTRSCPFGSASLREAMIPYGNYQHFYRIPLRLPLLP